MPVRQPRVFTIPSGAPFLQTLSRALMDGHLVDGFPGTAGPMALADATIYVPTQRAAQALASALLAASGGQSLLLPRIAPLGAFEPDEETAFLATDGDDAPRPGLPPAVGKLARRHALALLTRAWGQALRGAIRSVDADGMLITDAAEPALVATTPAQAYALAGDLASLIDDMIIEDTPWERLETVVSNSFDPYWRITLDFLKIAFTHWPEWLAEHGLIDRAKRVALLIDDEIEAIGSGARRGPTIIAGSTGANRATARLIATIARAPQGAVVLPDLDLELDDRAWSMIGASDGAAQRLATHPQALLHRLISVIGVRRDGVTTLGALSPNLAARSAFVSEALRPAETTDRWRERSRSLSPEAVADALDGVSIVVAESENEEALALAIAMREALETPGRSAALITPDPSLSRRVAVELRRWGVEVEDSALQTLGLSSAGTLARLVLQAAIQFTPLSLLALLAHPAVRFGRTRAKLEAASRALELAVFRAIPVNKLDDLDQTFAKARVAGGDRHAHPAIRRIGEYERLAAEALARDAVAALSALRANSATASLSEHLAAHRAAFDRAIDGREDAAAETRGLQQLSELFDEWGNAAVGAFPCALAEYATLFDSATANVRSPPAGGSHPRLQILGLLEARLLSFDLALLGGLDETVWPPSVETDAFLNRRMRDALGLSAPERRIGQTAHDFIAALGARAIVLSRSKKRGGAPTVASRFLQRIFAAAGSKTEAMREAERRGEHYLELARALDQPATIKSIERPAPCPAAGRRPRALSVTQIETLRRDPYAIYAEFILNLRPLDAAKGEPDQREVGIAWHGALEDFARKYPTHLLPDEARKALFSIAWARFAPLLVNPGFRGLNWPSIESALDFFLEFELGARRETDRIWVEQRGETTISLEGGKQFNLSARADRIDVLRSGDARLIDYKSGAPPTAKEVRTRLCAAIDLGGGNPDPRRLRQSSGAGNEARSLSQARWSRRRLGEGRWRQAGQNRRARRNAFCGAQAPARSIRLPKHALSFAPVSEIREPLSEI